MPNKALFLDRDGVINIDHGFVNKSENFDFNDGIFELCRLFQNNNYKILVVTNQSGVGRGYFSEKDLKNLHDHMLSVLKQEEISITDIYYCTSFDDADPDRKPNPGLFIKAREAYNLDMPASFSIGDKERDILAALNAGVGTNILLTECSSAVSKANDKVKSLHEVNKICIL